MTWESKDGRKWAPLGDTAVVQRAEPKTETAGGIIKAERYQGESIEGTVLSVGSGCKAGVVSGDVVMFGRHAGTPLSDEYGDRLLLLNGEEIRQVQIAKP